MGIERPDDPDGVKRVMSAFLELGDSRILIAKTKRGRIPVGLMLAADKGSFYEPHVSWFSWASPRNKLETMLRYFADRRHDATFVIISEIEWKDFWELLARYGVLKRIGTAHLNGGQPLTFWQSWVAKR